MLTICRFLYGADTDATKTPLTPEFDYRWKLIKDSNFQRERVMRETTYKCIAQNISVDGEGVDWVLEPEGCIKKVNLTFTDKFLWLLVHHCISPAAADNIVTWDRVVLINAMVVGFEVDFMWLL